ncbi:membrane protease YdiL (CAAX protease family) [Paenibacillus anaericanus]|uniref:CPBP family intramembrane glutamic endopeptidase n=1 Tax=Paenibacillus anaericanus TaxID=170367 RepID=UPI002783FBB9|nr:type II CAAX endopeptidase family protein [Paenibacillus anaericanus]MDQ0089449.1 membrane protease YdiL (CAAX protease family) [Paenibacillus anaericanus]
MNNKNIALRNAFLFVIMVAVFEAILLILPIELNTAMFMLLPSAATIITMLLTREAFQKEGWKSLGFGTFQGKSFMIGLLTPMLLIGISYAIVWTVGWGDLGVASENAGKGVELAIRFICILVAGSVTVVLGEELGWRGYLLPRLKSLGTSKALLWSSVIWGLFHLPIMIFTDLYHSEVNLYVYIPLFMLNVILAGMFIGFLRLKSNSIWPALIAHSAHNLAWSYGDLFTQNQSSIVNYMTGDAGILLIVGYALALLILFRRNKAMFTS